MPEPEKLEIVPKVVDTSAALNVVTDSLTVNVIVDVWPDDAVTLVGDAARLTEGAVESMVTELVETAERLPAASTAYTRYVPSMRPVAARAVAVFAVVIAIEFQLLSAAPVMLASVATLTELLTR